MYMCTVCTTIMTTPPPAPSPKTPKPLNQIQCIGIAPKGAPVGADGRPKRIQSERECLARYYHKVGLLDWGGVEH